MTKFMCKNELFQSLGTKTEFHAKFRDENNSLTLFFLLRVAMRGEGGGGSWQLCSKKRNKKTYR
jgi:hypothetical protein